MSPASHMVGRLRKLCGILRGGMRLPNERSTQPRGGHPGTAPHCAVEQLEPRVLLSTTILSDGFEGAFPGSWAVGNNSGYIGAKWGDNYAKAYAGSWSAFCADNGSDSRATYDNNLNTYMQRQSISLAGYATATLTFKYWLNTESTYDFVQVTARNQSGSWAVLKTISGNSSGWQTATVPMDSYAGQTGVIISFDFISDVNVVPTGAAGAWIDEVSLTATANRSPVLSSVYVTPTSGNTSTTFSWLFFTLADRVPGIPGVA